MSSPLVQSDAYYYLTSDRWGPNVYLSNGVHDVDLSLARIIFSSSNWQIFYQDPIYLIRNYDYGANLQLGIAEDSQTVPALMNASGSLTQQWNLTRWDDGTFRLSNMWLGSAQMLGVGNGSNDQVIPVMTASQDGSHWSFATDPSGATSNVNADMLQSVSLQAVRWNHDLTSTVGGS